MTDAFWVAMATALWLGFLTSISPCPLAANIAAVGYIGRRITLPRQILLSGLLYTLGRMLSYIGLSALLVFAALAIPDVARFLQHELNIVLGPVLVIVGLILLRVIHLPVATSASLASRLEGRVERWGLLGAIILGAVFAVSFCPISAALFFGSLMPLSLEHKSTVILPVLYGLGTAGPVVAFAFLLAFSAHLVGRAYNMLAALERWARPATAIVFLLVGLYYCKEYLFSL